MTIYDISKKAGVSIATVSRVLNGSDKVRPSTKKKVMDIIEKYDYTPLFSAVFQDYKIFSFTVEDNIKMCGKELSEGEKEKLYRI